MMQVANKKASYVATFVFGAVALAQSAYSQIWAQSTAGSPNGGPVNTIPIDGGPTYYADQSLTTTTAPITWNPGPNQIVYSTGWDSPNFFQFGPFLGFMRNRGEVTTYLSLGWNGVFGFAAPFSGQLDLAKNAGISNIVSAQFLNQIQNVDRAIGSETVGIYLWDEPGVAEIIPAQIQGYASTTYSGYIGGGYAGSSTGFVLTLTSQNYGTVDNGATFASGASGTATQFTGAGCTGTYPLTAISANTGSVTLSGSPSRASGTGTVKGNVMTITSGSCTGSFANGDTISGTGITNTPQISSATRGTGGTGVYQLSSSQTTSGPYTFISGILNVTNTPTGGVPVGYYLGAFVGQTKGTCNPYRCMVNSTPFLSGTGIKPSTNWPTCTGVVNTIPWTQIGSYCYGGTLTTLAPTTITQAAISPIPAAMQDTRFIDVGFGALNFLRFHNIFSALNGCCTTAQAFLPASYTSPSGKSRHIDHIGADLYFFMVSRSQNLQGNNNQSISNVYDVNGGSRPMTMQEAAVGAHYGDMIDIQRSLNSNSVPLWQVIETGECKCNVANYVIQPVEIDWAVWASIIHGARGVAWFDNDDGVISFQKVGPENIYAPYYRVAQSSTASVSVSGSTLTVTSQPMCATTPSGNCSSAALGAGILAPGMVFTSGSGVSCSVAPCMILQQTDVAGPTRSATFAATFSGTNNTTMTVSNVVGTITVPSTINGAGITGLACTSCPNPNFLNINITGGSAPTYTVDANVISSPGTPKRVTSQPVATFTAAFSGTNNTTLKVSGVSGTIVVPCTLTGLGVTNAAGTYNLSVRSGTGPTYTVDATGSVTGTTPNAQGTTTCTPTWGAQGTYQLAGTLTGSGTATFQQQYGRGNNSFSATGMTALLTANSQAVRDMAPVINSPFVKNYVTPTPVGYQFDKGMNQANGNIQSFTFGISTGIETMAKQFAGPSYTASTGETISAGYYIFADTRFPSTQSKISATFTLPAGCGGTTATVIGESRSIPISSCSFSDTFNNAWTVHIYKIQ